MKKAIPHLLTVTLLTLATAVLAQKHIGMSTGVGWSKQTGFAVGAKSARVHSFVLQYSKQTTEKWGWQTDFGITQHGFREQQIEFDYTTQTMIETKADLRSRYLEIASLTFYRIPLGQKGFEIAPLFGASIGYMLSSKIVARSNGENETTHVSIKVTQKVPLEGTEFADKFDSALLLGVRAAYPLGNVGSAFLEFRWHFGIWNLDREAASNMFNRSTFLRMGYRHTLSED